MEKELLNTFDKELLLKDLCARLPYGVRVFVSGDDFDNYQCPYLLIAISKFGQDIFCKIYSPIYTPLGCPGIENVKPYLFPLSSMTEKQIKELEEIDPESHSLICENGDVCISMGLRGYDWLNKNHFDYRGLIEKGLAIDATGLNVY